MEAVLLVVHLMLAIILVGFVLLQRSEGGGLGIGGGGMGGLMSGRSATNLLTRVTAVLAGLFMLTSLALAIVAAGEREPTSILDQPPAATEPVAPEQPVGPQVPLAR
jgi:preprotein translocase subunit SecG